MPKTSGWSYKRQRERSPKSEVICDVCNGLGTPPVIKDGENGRKVYPAVLDRVNAEEVAQRVF